MNIFLKLTCFLVTAGILFVPVASQAQNQGSFGKVIRINRNAFSPEAGLITFSEKPVTSRNPFYRPADYGAGSDGVNVTFSGYFQGQRLAKSGQCPRGASRSGCLSGKPTAPLRLSASAPNVFIASDRANPTSPSLSGTPMFNGPVSVLFDRDIAGVGLAGGYFDAVRSTAIQVFDRKGNLIGGVKNITKGMEYLALVTEDGRNRIAGLQFSLVGPEPAGYAIDELSFAFSSQLNRGQIGSLKDAMREDTSAESGNVSPKPVKPDKKPPGSLSGIFENPAAKPTKKPKGGLAELFEN